jgi:competence CoiA-like predicted nuclease
MLVALNEDGNRIYARDAVKTDEDGNKLGYYCPECGSELILRQGTKNIWHYAHKSSDMLCGWLNGGGESIVHQAMKDAVKEIIERDNNCLKSELEWRLGSRIADYYFEVKDRYGNLKKVAVECVHKHTDIDVFREKTEYYAKHGFYVLWIFNLSKFLEDNIFFKREMQINEIIKECHTMYFGRVYAVDLDNRVMYGIHLNSAKEWIKEKTLINWELWDGHSDPNDLAYTVGGYYKYKKRIKELSPVLLFEFIIDSFSKARPDKWLPYKRYSTGTYTEKWW